ncbi:MAG: NYN domain-containing protein [Gammaproteobacteria bacterium]|nr:NYN domain-containing protein [Gammaproteobacteria bacterium]MDE0156571.1 NYN domain-containing protein [Gammaproteobacteria bacterium]
MGRVALLIDGGYFLKRLPTVRPDIDASDPEAVARSIDQLIRGHLDQLNEIYKVENIFQLLYRTFYYDAQPYGQKAHTPIDKRPIDYSKTSQASFRKKLFNTLHSHPNLAIRLGEVRRERSHSWILKMEPQKKLLNGDLSVGDLSDSDFVPALRQKGVDMRIGLDIASITLKRQADVIILVSGDADFVPAAKLARREGMQFILDPLWQNVPRDLFEHIDGLRSGFYKPQSKKVELTGRTRNKFRSDDK